MEALATLLLSVSVLAIVGVSSPGARAAAWQHVPSHDALTVDAPSTIAVAATPVHHGPPLAPSPLPAPSLSPAWTNAAPASLASLIVDANAPTYLRKLALLL